MSCITKEQWKEVYNNALTELNDKQELGEDISEALAELKAMNNSIIAGEIDKAKKILDKANKSITWLDSSTTAEANAAKPKIGNKNVITTRVGRTADGNIRYGVKYTRDGQEYIMNSFKLKFDHIDAKYNNAQFANMVNAMEAEEVKYDKLEYDIWNDQDNALKLFDEMTVLDGSTNSHTEYLRDLVESITDPAKEILNKFKVYLNKEADDNFGFATIYDGRSDSKIKLNVVDRNKKGDKFMSAAEVYAHELVHMSVETARQFRKGPLANTISSLHKLMEQASGFITADKLVEHGMDREHAEQVYNYIFNNANLDGISEFIAYGLTNEAFKSALKEMDVKHKTTKSKREGLWGKMLNKLLEIYDHLREMINLSTDQMKGDERLGWLVGKLWEHNNISSKKASVLAQVRAVADVVVDRTNKGILDAAGYVGRAVDDGLNIVLSEELRQAKEVAKVMNPFVEGKQKDIRDRVIASMRQDFNDTWFGWMLQPEGMAVGMLERVSADDSLITKLERIGLVNNALDRLRDRITKAVGGGLLKEMGKPSAVEQVAITNVVMKNDLAALVGRYNPVKIHRLVENDSERKAEIVKIENKIAEYVKHKEIANYYKAQAKALGKYMQNGISGRLLNKNALDIVKMKGVADMFDIAVGEDVRIQFDRNNKKHVELLRDIDILASLYGIENTTAEDRVRYGKVEKKGIEHLLRHMLHEQIETVKFMQDNKFMEPKIKGAIKDVSASTKSHKIDSNNTATKKRMKKDGWKYVGDTAVAGMGLYVKNIPEYSEFEKQAFAKINVYKRVHSMTEHYMQNIDEVTQEGLDGVVTELANKEINGLDSMEDFINQLEGGDVNLDGYSVVYDRNGKVVDYSVTVDKSMLEEAMEMELSAPLLMGRMMAEISEKEEAVKINNTVLNVLYSDAKDNYKREEPWLNKQDYIELGPDAINSSKRERELAEKLWKDLPMYVRKDIENKGKGAKWLAIRRNAVEITIGARVPSILDMKIGYKKRTLGEQLDVVKYGKEVKRLLENVALVWDEVTGFAKTSIVIRTPMVIVNNVLSNVNYMIAMGQWPWEAVNDHVKLFKATKEYLDNQKEYDELTMKIKSKIGVTKEMKDRTERLKMYMKNSPVADTMNAGLFTAKIEDTDVKELQKKGLVEAKLEKYTDRIPKVVRDGASFLYMRQGTGLFDAMSMTVQYSDFVFRTARYNYLTANGMPKETAIKTVIDEAVNYTRLLPTVARWMDKAMIFPFLRYFFGANKVLVDKAKTRPLSVALMAISNDVGPNPTDALFWEKDWDYSSNSPLEVLEKDWQYATNPAFLRMVGVL